MRATNTSTRKSRLVFYQWLIIFLGVWMNLRFVRFMLKPNLETAESPTKAQSQPQKKRSGVAGTKPGRL